MRKSEVILPLNMFVDLKRAGPVPLYFQVSSTIEEAIRSGQIQPGSRLENEVSLGERLGLSRPTIRRAIQELVDKGLLVRRRGIGTQVVHGQVTRGVELTSLFDDLVQSGQHPSTTVLTCEIEPAEASIAEELMISPGSPVLKIERIRAADGVPVGLLTNWLTTVDLGITKSDLEEHGLYQILRGRAVAIRVAKQRIGARKATNQEADRLDISHGEAVLTMDRTSFNSAGVAIEFGHHCYRPDLYSFEATLVEK